MSATSSSQVDSPGSDVFGAEIERYLDAVELFRAQGCEPTWLPEKRVAAPTQRGGPPSLAATAERWR
jgi:hypothetical protein